MQRIAYSSSFIPCKNQRKLLTRGVIFTVNTYECFMEKKEHSTVVNLKKNIEPNQTFTGSYKKREALGELQDTHNIKSKKANKFWRKLSDQDNVRLKDYVCLSKKEAYNNK